MLYSPLVLDETTFDDTGGVRVVAETTFRGGVVVSEAASPLVKKWLSGLTHVGSGVARGFGHVSVEVEEGDGDDPRRRVQNFSELLGGRWELWKPLKGERVPDSQYGPGVGTFFSITLMSDAVLREGGWSPTVRLEPEMLGDAGRNATLLRCYASADYRGGWNTAW